MDHLDMISHNSDYESINLADPRILVAETSHKYNLHLGEAMKSYYQEYFMTVMGKEIKYLTTEDFWEIIPKSSLPASVHIIRLIWILKIKRNPFR